LVKLLPKAVFNIFVAKMSLFTDAFKAFVANLVKNDKLKFINNLKSIN